MATEQICLLILTALNTLVAVKGIIDAVKQRRKSRREFAVWEQRFLDAKRKGRI